MDIHAHDSEASTSTLSHQNCPAARCRRTRAKYISPSTKSWHCIHLLQMDACSRNSSIESIG